MQLHHLSGLTIAIFPTADTCSNTIQYKSSCVENDNPCCHNDDKSHFVLKELVSLDKDGDVLSSNGDRVARVRMWL